MYMLLLVLDDADHLDAVLSAWNDIGVRGVTMMESTGAYRRRQVRPLGARYLFAAAPVMETVERGQYTLFTVVPNLETVNACQDAVEAIVGDLDGPNTGVMLAWELAHVKGVPNTLNRPEDEA